MAYCIENFFEDMSTKDSKTKFILPAIQRGFVWKAYQIENFWDSLARSFPIGSFIVKENIHNDNHEVHILDGQQRASAILIGMTGVKDDSPFNIANNKMRLFIDLEDPYFTREESKEENSEENENESEEIASTEETIIEKRFVFRCITRSHPWGYQKNKNTKRLETKDIRYALEYFENKYVEDEKIIKDDTHYYAVDNNAFLNFFPYDCMVSLPVDKIFSAKDKNAFIKEVKEYLKDIYGNFISIDSTGTIQINDISKETNLENMDIPTKGLRVYLKNLFSDKKNKEEVKPPKFFNLGIIYDKLIAIKQYGLTFCTLDNNPIKFDKQENSNVICQQNKIDDADIETVFYRINMGGTRLTEDDLNYSLFKSCMKDTNLIKNFENACTEILEPAKAFKLAYLLYKQVNKGNNELTYSTVKYEEIKKAITNKKNSFLQFIKKYFIEGKILDKYKEILVYNNENEKGIPFTLFIKINSSAPELVFLLLYRLVFVENENGDYTKITAKNKKNIIGLFLSLYWLYRGENQRTYRELLYYIWPLVNSTFNLFWSQALLDRANLIYDKPLKLNYTDIENEEYFQEKIYKEKILRKNILFNNELVLYAQRKTLSLWFVDDEYLLEDNSRPFDFDHICPNSYNRGISNTLKKYNYINSIGNMRAWPFELNRHDKDGMMFEKIEEPNFSLTVEKRIRKKFKLANEKLSTVFHKWTFLPLSKEIWNKEKLSNVTSQSVKGRKGKVTPVKKFIDARAYKIYEEWYTLIANLTYYQYLEFTEIKNKLELICSRALQQKEITQKFSEIKILFEDKRYPLLNENIIVSLTDENDSENVVEEVFTLGSYSKESLNKLADEIKKFIENCVNEKNNRN